MISTTAYKDKVEKGKLQLSSDHGGFLLPEVVVIMVSRDHVGRVPSCHGGGGALHDHQADGGLGRSRVWRILLGGVFTAAVVHDAGDQEDQQQHDIAGDEDAEVERDRVDLLVVLQKTHGARSIAWSGHRGRPEMRAARAEETCAFPQFSPSVRTPRSRFVPLIGRNLGHTTAR